MPHTSRFAHTDFRRRAMLWRVTDPQAEWLRVPRSGRPSVVGGGELDYLCPGCLRVLCEGITPGDLAGLTLRCSCGTVGRVPA
jgi:hypothetical protein